ncbi:MAG TPA: LLM class flavin-dependent oxidoreductase [Candidatus Dormibacteraeota bacterium]|nr:LLM class flavin-dependent oxidoreductase [Candidatus Dormibacteraeota bacterium]
MPRIDFGLWLDVGLPSQTLASRLEELAPLLAAAEEAGFGSVWVGEAWPRGPREWHQQIPSLPLLAALASLTPLRLGTGVLLLPAWSPLNLAYQAAALDQLSGGRLTLGVGSGMPDLRERFGVARERLGERLDETIVLLKSLWAGAPGFSGRLLSAPGPIAPLPVQPGGPPVLPGGRVERALKRAALLGDGWYAATTYPLPLIERLATRYRALCAGAGRPAGAVTANRFFAVAGSREEAERAAEPYRAALDEHYGVPPETHEDVYLVGDPEHVNRLLEGYAAAGVTQIAARVAPAGLPVQQAVRTVRLLGREVVPAWR